MKKAKNMTLNLKNYRKIRTPFVFFDETGSINDQANRFFGLGMIKCMQPYFLDSKIRLIRQKHYFFDEIKWNTLSKVKIKIIKEIINIVFETPGIYFSSVIINKDDINFEKEFKSDPYKAYRDFTELLLIQSIGSSEVLTVLADYVSVPKNIKFEVDVKHRVNEQMGRLAIGGVHRVDSKGLNLIQIVDLFLGAVVYEYKIKNRLVKGDKNKLKILRFLLNKLDRKSFMKGLNMRRFKVIEYKKGPSS